jgi:HEAT repeat protein
MRWRAILAAAVVVASMAGETRASLWPDVPGKVKAELASPDVARRRAAASALANLPLDEATPLLVQAVSDADVDVRLIASGVAARRGVTAVTDAILPWLTDTEARLREGACDFFAELPQPKVVKVLSRALGDTVPTVRLAAVRALGNSASADAVAPLLARLDDGNSKVRVAVARALGRLDDKRAVTPLVSKVQDEASEVRQAVVRALGELGDTRAAPALVIALADAALEVRIEALAALGRMRAKESVPSIAPLTVEPPKKANSADVRRAALAALGRIGSPQALEAIVRAFGAYEDASSGVATSPAREAAIGAGDVAGPLLLARLRDGQLTPSPATVTAGGGTPTTTNVSASAAWVLGELRVEGAGDVIVKAMRRGDVPATVALHALASLGDPAQLPTCLEQVASTDKPVRAEALGAAASLLDPEHPDGRAVEPLLASLEQAQTPEERAEIATLLGRTGAARVAPTLIGLAQAKDEGLKLAAVDALGTLGASEAGPALVKLLDDPSGVVRMHAAIALGKSGGADVVGAALDRLATSAEADRLAVVLAVSGLVERHGDAAAVERVRKALADVGAERDLLVVALGRAKDPSATKALVDLLAASTNDVDTRRAIALALGARANDATAAASLRTLLTDVEPTVRAQAAWSLGAIGAPGDVALLGKLLSDGAASVAGNAMAAIGRLAPKMPAISSPAVPAALCSALVDDRAYVRANALGALLQIAHAKRPARCNDGAVERRLLAEDGNEVVRTFAARLEGALPPPAKPDEISPARAALERCTLVDPSGAVAATCREMLLGREPLPSTSTSALTIFLAASDAGPPIARTAYAVERPEGLLHLGTSDRRGAVVELLLATKGVVRLRVANPASSP